MPAIITSIFVNAPMEQCFDISRSIDIHMDSTAHTHERAVSGRTSGLIEQGETVTWEAVHLGITQHLTVVITEFEKPFRFVDEMVSGAFERFTHEHSFESRDGGTWMVDTFDYTSPYGWVGKAFDVLFLKSYMKRFLSRRNLFIKTIAEKENGED